MKHSISTDIKPPLIDLDIKLYNMVLGLPQDDYYPAYPTVKMIDFGEAFDNDRYPYYEAKEGGVGIEGFGQPVRFPKFHIVILPYSHLPGTNLRSGTGQVIKGATAFILRILFFVVWSFREKAGLWC